MNYCFQQKHTSINTIFPLFIACFKCQNAIQFFTYRICNNYYSERDFLFSQHRKLKADAKREIILSSMIFKI